MSAMAVESESREREQEETREGAPQRLFARVRNEPPPHTRGRRTRARLDELCMPNKAPNPLLFVGLSLASFGAFYLLARHRATTYPASAQPRQHDNPLVPPRHHGDNDDKAAK